MIDAGQLIDVRLGRGALQAKVISKSGTDE
jgi:hypothetical protein